MASVSTVEHSPHITFDEFRNFFILLPRKISPAEIYKYYEMRKYMGDDGRGAARVNMEGNYYKVFVHVCDDAKLIASRRRQPQCRRQASLSFNL